MVIVLITGDDGFDVALRKTAEANKIEWPKLPVSLERAQENPTLGSVIAVATALATMWAGAPDDEDYVATCARRLGWRKVDLAAIIRRCMASDRAEKVLDDRLTLDDLGFNEAEIKQFFHQAGIRIGVFDTLDVQTVGTIGPRARGENPKRPEGQLRMMERFGVQLRGLEKER